MSAIRFLFIASLLCFSPAMSGPWFPMAPVRPIGGTDEPQISPTPVDVGKHSPVIISSGPIYIGGGRHSCSPSDYSDAFVLNSAKAPSEDQAGGIDAGPGGVQMQSANPGAGGAQMQSANPGTGGAQMQSASSGPAPVQPDVPAPAPSRRQESPRVKKWARMKRSHSLESDDLEDFFSEGRRSSDDDSNTTGENEEKNSKSLLPGISAAVRTNLEERYK